LLIHTFVVTWLDDAEALALAAQRSLCGKLQAGRKPAAGLLGNAGLLPVVCSLCWLPAGWQTTPNISAFYFQDAQGTKARI